MTYLDQSDDTKAPWSDSTKRLINDYTTFNAPKEKKSSLELCGLVKTKDMQKLEKEMGVPLRGSRGRRMSLPVLPTQSKPKVNLSRQKDTNDILEQEPTGHVYNPKDGYGRTDLANLKKDLNLLRPQSINQLRIGGSRKNSTGRHASGNEVNDQSSLEEQFEALRLCRYLRQPGKELKELDTKEIFSSD